MAVAFVGSTSGTSTTLAHTTGSGANRALLGMAHGWDAGGWVSSMAYNSDALALEAQAGDDIDSDYTYVYSMAAPDSGANNLVVTESDAASEGPVYGASDYTGVYQTDVIFITGTHAPADGSDVVVPNGISGWAIDVTSSYLEYQALDDLIVAAVTEFDEGHNLAPNSGTEFSSYERLNNSADASASYYTGLGNATRSTADSGWATCDNNASLVAVTLKSSQVSDELWHRVSVNGSSGSTSTTSTIPADVVAGDLLIVSATSRDSTGASPDSTCTDNDTGGNAWTLITNSTDKKAWAWRKFATSGTAGKTVTVGSTVGSATCCIAVVLGADTTTPITDASAQVNASGTEAHTGFTPDNDDSMVCLSVHQVTNDTLLETTAAAATSPGALNQRVRSISTAGSDCSVMFASRLQVGSATATGNLTWAQTNAATASIAFAIKKAATATPAETEFGLHAISVGRVGSQQGLSGIELGLLN